MNDIDVSFFISKGMQIDLFQIHPSTKCSLPKDDLTRFWFTCLTFNIKTLRTRFVLWLIDGWGFITPIIAGTYHQYVPRSSINQKLSTFECCSYQQHASFRIREVEMNERTFFYSGVKDSRVVKYKVQVSYAMPNWNARHMIC